MAIAPTVPVASIDAYQLAFGGLTIGADTDYEIVDIEGLLSLPDIRSGDLPRARRDGLSAGEDYLGARFVSLTVEIHSDDDDDIQTNVQALMDAFQTERDESILSFRFPGVADGTTAFLGARLRRRSIPLTLQYQYGLPVAKFQFDCTDSRIYASSQESGTINRVTASGGLAFDDGAATPMGFDFPFTFGAVTGGVITSTNTGNYNMPVVLTVSGPIDNFKITNETTDEHLHYTGEIVAGDSIVLDTNVRTALLNDTASRYYRLTSDSTWFDLVPGDNDITFEADSGSGTLNIAHRAGTWV